MFGGTHTAWMIVYGFKTDTHNSTFSCFEDMIKLAWPCDSRSHMEGILNEWDSLIENIGPTAMTIEAHRDLFASKTDGI